MKKYQEELETEVDISKVYCRMCGIMTNAIVNIKFRATPLCNPCANSITSQQLRYLIKRDEENKEEDLK